MRASFADDGSFEGRVGDNRHKTAGDVSAGHNLCCERGNNNVCNEAVVLIVGDSHALMFIDHVLGTFVLLTVGVGYLFRTAVCVNQERASLPVNVARRAMSAAGAAKDVPGLVVPVARKSATTLLKICSFTATKSSPF